MGFQRGRTGALVIGGYGFLDTATIIVGRCIASLRLM
jgi:hypothetical protein